jgi:hypothetical protein
MAGLLDNDAAAGTGDADLAEYRRRLQALPMFDERQLSLDELRRQRALTALREDMLTRTRPAQMPGALAQLGGMVPGSAAAASPYTPPGLLSPPDGSNPAGTLVVPPAGDFSGRMTGSPSANIEDRQGEFGWQNVARWLAAEQSPVFQRGK